MNPPSEHDKVIFQLTMLSNLAAAYPKISDKDLRQKITDCLKGPLASWEVCWGPHVVQAPIKGTLNTMYVAKEQKQDNYVVAIAGTSPYSLFDWFWEDFWVNLQVPWVYAPFADAKIAFGTASGLVILQSMKPEKGAVASGTRLWDFLKSLTDSPINVTVAGHSLGGALAPTLALWLRDTQGIPFLWDPHEHATVMTMPFAGATAGDGKFAAHSNEKLPHGTLPSATAASFRYANSLDVVPHAWNLDTLNALKTVYVPYIPENEIVDKLVELATKAAADGDYTQLTPDNPPWKGTVNQSKIKPGGGPLEPFFNFLQQILYQHVQAYLAYFGVDTELLPAPAKTPVPAVVKQLVEKAGGTLPSDLTVSPEPASLYLDAFVTDPGGDEQSRVDALVAEMKKFAAEQ